MTTTTATATATATTATMRWWPVCAYALACATAGGCGSGTPGTDAPPIDASGADALPAFVCAPPTTPPTTCDALPSLPVPAVHVPPIPASEDFTFDRDGFLLGVGLDTHALQATTRDGDSQIIQPNVSDFGRGTRVLRGGDIAVADPGINSLVRIARTGGSTVILGGLPDPNGIAVGLDGFVYLTHGGGQVRRIDPDTGAFTVLVSTPDRSYDGITFSPDYRTLYYNEESGAIHALAIGDDGTPGASRVVATIPPAFLLDGMTADTCGNVYVVEMDQVVWRMTPAGEVEMVADLHGVAANASLIPAINFGSGVGGWCADALYVMDFSGGVYEVVVGVRGKREPHLP